MQECNKKISQYLHTVLKLQSSVPGTIRTDGVWVESLFG